MLVKKKSPMSVTSDCLGFLKSQTSEVILFYSGGKDSLCLIDLLTKKGFKVNCCFMYFIKDMEHINKYMNWAKASDSMARNFMMKSYLLNSISESTKHAYPLSAWKKGDVLAYLKMNRIPMPISYDQKNTRSSGLDLKGDVLYWIKNNYPNDLKKILEVFPLSEMLIQEYERDLEISKV